VTVPEILDILSRGGLLAGAVLIIVAFLAGWLYTREYVRELRADKRELLDAVRGFAASNDRLSALLDRALIRLEAKAEAERQR
jgi:hypothetical protein